VRPKAFLFFSFSLSCSFAKCASRASNYFINHLSAVVVTVVVVVVVVVAEAPRLAECVWRFFLWLCPDFGAGAQTAKTHLMSA